MNKIRSIEQAADLVLNYLRENPHRDLLSAQRAVLAGERRRWPVIYVGHLGDPDDHFQPTGEWEPPEVDMPAGVEADLAREMVGMLAPRKMDNPVRPVFGLGPGTGSLVPCFGIGLNPQAGDAPSRIATIDELLAAPAPDPAESGLLPEMRSRVEAIRKHAPEGFYISLPDTQGPYNLVHMMVGDEAFLAPLTEPQKFADLMARVTDLFLGAWRSLIGWIGPARLDPWYSGRNCIRECSVNLISAEMYVEHVLPFDLRVAEEWGEVGIHPCSGPHVFRATLEHVPNVAHTEAGFVDRAAAGAISVDDALAAIGDRPIGLGIGQELPEGGELELICRDLDRYVRYPRLTFSYTGMHWRKKDRPLVRDVHRQADEYWRQQGYDRL